MIIIDNGNNLKELKKELLAYISFDYYKKITGDLYELLVLYQPYYNFVCTVKQQIRPDNNISQSDMRTLYNLVILGRETYASIKEAVKDINSHLFNNSIS